MGAKKAVYPTMSGSQKSGVPYHKWERKSRGLNPQGSVLFFTNFVKKDIIYKNLLSNQLSWCNSNRDTIVKQAKKLYEMIVSGKAWPTLAGRCCNFSVDEQQYLLYCKTHLEEDR